MGLWGEEVVAGGVWGGGEGGDFGVVKKGVGLEEGVRGRWGREGWG